MFTSLFISLTGWLKINTSEGFIHRIFIFPQACNYLFIYWSWLRLCNPLFSSKMFLQMFSRYENTSRLPVDVSHWANPFVALRMYVIIKQVKVSITFRGDFIGRAVTVSTSLQVFGNGLNTWANSEWAIHIQNDFIWTKKVISSITLWKKWISSINFSLSCINLSTSVQLYQYVLYRQKKKMWTQMNHNFV